MSRTRAAVLVVERLHVDYGHIRAVQGASLTVSRGTTAILGANGAGKSSLVRAVAGAQKPSAGRVTLGDGTDITPLPAHRRVLDMGIVLVPEGRSVLPRLTVAENLAFGFRVGAQRARRARWAASSGRTPAGRDELLGLFPQLARHLRSQARYLSGGEQQMLGIARALAMNPDVLLVDEPSLGLSPAAVKALFGAIRRVVAERDISLVLVEQDPIAAISLSDHAYVMERGRIEFGGPAAELADGVRLRNAYLGATLRKG